MNYILVAIGLLGKVASAVPTAITTSQASVTTICSTASYNEGTVDAAFSRPVAIALAAGSAASSALVRASTEVNQLQTQSILDYGTAIRFLQAPLGQVTSLTNADVADIIDVNAQLVTFLDALAHTTVNLLNPTTVGTALYEMKISVSIGHSSINKLLSQGRVSCDKQNSLNSIGSKLSSAFDALKSVPRVGAYLSLPVRWYTVPSVSCTTEVDCTTITLTSTASSTIASNTDSSTTDSTSTGTEKISSRTVSGTVERCIVRPTATTTADITTIIY